MQKIIVFLDIDGVIFDASKFFTNFCNKFIRDNNLQQDEVTKLQGFYKEVKKEKGFF